MKTKDKKPAKVAESTVHKSEKHEKVTISATGGTFIAHCGKARCDSKFQDKAYGTDMRVFNKKRDSKQGVCTVCGQASF